MDFHYKKAMRILSFFLLISFSSSFTARKMTPINNKNQVVYSESSMDETYDKLAQRLYDKVFVQHQVKSADDTIGKNQQPSSSSQYWVAIAGGPGSGKTTTANAVADLLNQKYTKDENCCIVLPMDGFHYSKQKLQELDPPDGENYLKRRGAPWTMDADRCCELLTQAKEQGQGELPSYSREISDPVPGGVQLLPEHKIVLVEGLYLLGNIPDDPRWEPLQQLWDERWFVRCPSRDMQRERLIQRSLKTWNDLKVKTWGEGEIGATSKVDANDAKNMDIVAPGEQRADVVIESR
jgi:pantothenate kinase